jgi:hypothetical protein
VCGGFCGVKHCKGGELVILAEERKERWLETSMTAYPVIFSISYDLLATTLKGCH